MGSDATLAAVAAYRQSIREGEASRGAHRLRHVADALRRSGHHLEALPLYALVLSHHARVGEEGINHANALRPTGLSLRALGRLSGARIMLEAAIARYRSLHVRDGVTELDAVVSKLPQCPPVERVDHLIWFFPDLDQGRAQITDLLGATPMIGGQHPLFGTHNAILSLGGRCYLEVIAPAPHLPAPAGGRLSDRWSEPGMKSWAVTSAAVQQHATACPVALGSPREGARVKPDGTRLTWTMTDIYADRMEGTVPFLLDWGDSPHPAQDAPGGGRLLSVDIGHPEAARVNKALSSLDLPFRAHAEAEAGLTAVVQAGSGFCLLL